MYSEWVVSRPTPMVGSRALVIRGEWTMRYLQKCGVRVPAGSRLPNAVRLLDRLNTGELDLIGGGESFRRSVAAAHRTAWESFLITYASSLHAPRPTPFTVPKLEVMLGGPDEVEGRDRHARNTQFELYVAAMLRLGGAEVEFGEPDLLLRFGRERLGVAMKRVASARLDQLSRHFRKALEQMQGARVRGFVAVNVDARFAEHELPSERSDRIALFERVFRSLDGAVEAHEGHAAFLGVMVFGYLAQWRLPPETDVPVFDYTNPFRFFMYSGDPAEELLFREFSTTVTQRHRQQVECLSDDACIGSLIPSGPRP